MNHTSGHREPVWLATEPYSSYPRFARLNNDVVTDVVIVGAGITGISTALELVRKGVKTTLIDARDVLSGETGRTSAHLSSVLDRRYYEYIKLLGEEKAKHAYESHEYAIRTIGENAKEFGIDCEYRTLPGYLIVNVPKSDPGYTKANDLEDESKAMGTIGYASKVEYESDGSLGAAYQGAILKFADQATFHPTKYCNGLLTTLMERYGDLFECYTHTRMRSYTESAAGVEVVTEGDLGPEGHPFSSEGGHRIRAKQMIMATNVPINAVNLIIKEAYYRTYCVAMKIPKGDYPDILIYDNADPYIYVKKTAHPDTTYEYLMIGGEDHKVGIESKEGYASHFENLVKWGKAHFPTTADPPEYAWSGQVVIPSDSVAFIGPNPGSGKNVFVVTGDSGDGLTHGVIAARIIADLIKGVSNPWSGLYSPSRLPTRPSTVVEVVQENVQQQLQYSRFLKSDVTDIEEIPRCSGAVMKGGLLKNLGKPLAVFKGEDGKTTTFSAICPHLHGVVAWNAVEQSWDCPIHGSRFDGQTGKCVFGPSNRGLEPQDQAAKMAVEADTSG